MLFLLELSPGACHIGENPRQTPRDKSSKSEPNIGVGRWETCGCSREETQIRERVLSEIQAT